MILYNITERARVGSNKKKVKRTRIEWIYVHTLEAALRKRFMTAMPSSVSVTP